MPYHAGRAGEAWRVVGIACRAAGLEEPCLFVCS